jgi:cyclic pyranopterin phosphate synthase
MSKHQPLEDAFGRIHNYLRVSVTDRCNYRCVYCMPEEGLNWVPRSEILRYEEIARIVTVMASMGIDKVRITGGEPTIRADIISLIESIAAIPGIDDVAMTTNGHTLAKLAPVLRSAGLKRVNISIDSLQDARFSELTRGGNLQRVLAGIEAARDAGLTPIKLNVVLLDGLNDDELFDFVDFCAPHAGDTELRFIEYMPFEVRRFKTVPTERMRAQLRDRFAFSTNPVRGASDGPARTLRLAESGLKVGFISPLSEHFCATCNRLRLVADGHLRTCLAHEDTPSLRDLVRDGKSDSSIRDAIRTMVLGKPSGHDCQVDGGTLFEGVMTTIGG